ncbi:MAG: hypothetical protein DA328_02845 [Nitrososphaeraceae archaeon]|nr:hypothetical protein [Nitrososphaeraceae archaeon]
MKVTKYKNNISIFIFIIVIGIALSILSYQYSSFTSDEIKKIAEQDVRSNAKIQTYDLSRILVHSLDSITTNLKLLTNLVLLNDTKYSDVYLLMNAAQDSTYNLTHAYFLVDENGKLIVASDSNAHGFINIGNFSNEEYFTIPKQTLKPYYSSVIKSNNDYPELFLSFPITTYKDDEIIHDITGNQFYGIVGASISIKSLGNFLQKELSSSFLSNVGLIDKTGIILYARDQSLIGRHYLSDEFQSLIPQELKENYNNILKNSLSGNSATNDLTYKGLTTTLSYQPIVINDKHLWTLYISTPHQLASNVGFLINQQKNFSTIIVIVIGSIAIGIAYLILSWNRSLKQAVDTRTSQLRFTNVSLMDSNRKLADANKQLKVHDKMQKEFINIAAHELRTPIMPILGEIEFIETQVDPVKKTAYVDEEQIKLIIRNAKRLDRLASDILDVTRIESKSLKLNKTYFSLKDLLIGTVKDLTNQIGMDENSKKISINYNPIEITVFADKDRINQVIYNLLSNALKFTENGSITINTEVKDKNVLVIVKDTGSGIDPEIFPRLFCKFATKSEKGTGLGLYISKNIVDAHGGKIWAKNNSNEKGATFIFSIPYIVKDDDFEFQHLI